MLKSFVTYAVILLFSVSVTAQKDTVYFDNLMSYEENIFVSSEFSFNPETDTIYNRIDSSGYNGILQFRYYDRSGGQEKLKVLSEIQVYSVKNGHCKPVHSVRYFLNPQETEQKNIQSKSFFSDNSSEHISFNINGNPWCIERYYIDSLGAGRSEKLLLDSLGRLMSKIQRKDGYLDGLIQYVISSGDTLMLRYESSHLVNVLNDNVLFFSEENGLISENEFIDRDSDWVYHWSYIVVPGEIESKIVFYRYSGIDCEIRAISEGYCLTKKRRKRITKKVK